MTNNWHIAQMNIGNLLYPIDDPRVAEFSDNLDLVNKMAEDHEGFVWRLKDEETGNASNIQIGDDPTLIVNMSVWTNIDSLFEFVYKTAHTAFIGKRKEWFEMPTQPIQALWWVPTGHQPTPQEGMARLKKLRQSGPCAEAFNFKNKFLAPNIAA